MDVDDINWLVKSCCEAEDISVLPVFKSTFPLAFYANKSLFYQRVAPCWQW